MFALIAFLVACGPQAAVVTIDGPDTITVHNLDPVPLPLATAADTAGTPLPTQPAITWTVTPAELATVDPVAGTVTPVAEGRATVTASTGAVTASLTLVVAVPDSIEVQGLASGDTVVIGESRTLAAAVLDGTTPMEGMAVTWESKNPEVAVISPEGLLSAVGPGDVTLMAHSGELVKALTLTVVAPALTDGVVPEGGAADM